MLEQFFRARRGVLGQLHDEIIPRPSSLVTACGQVSIPASTRSTKTIGVRKRRCEAEYYAGKVYYGQAVEFGAADK